MCVACGPSERRSNLHHTNRSDAPDMRFSSLVGVVALLAVFVPSASGHAMPTSAVELDAGAHTVRGELRLPLDRLAVALGRPLPPAKAGGSLRTSLERYSATRIRAVGDDGRAWRVTVTG